MLYTLLIVFYVLVSASLIGLILFQQGKGADAGAAFGSGSSGTVFGARGAGNFLTRSTAWLATLFFILSLSLAYVVHGRSGGHSVVESDDSAAAAPAAPKVPDTTPAPVAAPLAPQVPASGPAAQGAPAPASVPAVPSASGPSGSKPDAGKPQAPSQSTPKAPN